MFDKIINNELKLSEIVLGSCYFGTEISYEESFNLLDKYYELGGRTIDTARVYASWLPNGESASEKAIGEWIKSRNVRNEITLVTKGGHPPLNNMRFGRLDSESIFYDVMKSLESLSLPSIDLYFLHRDDHSKPVEEIMITLNELIKCGFVKNIGVSNWSIDRINEANKFARDNDLKQISVSQIQWSLAKTTPEIVGDPTLICMDDYEYNGYLESKIPVMAFSSQAKGLFSKYLSGAPLNPKIKERFLNSDNIERARRTDVLAKKYGVTPSAVVLSYITSNRVEGVAIVGCSNVAQLEDSMKYSDLKLTKEDINFLINGEVF